MEMKSHLSYITRKSMTLMTRSFRLFFGRRGYKKHTHSCMMTAQRFYLVLFSNVKVFPIHVETLNVILYIVACISVKLHILCFVL